MLASVSRVMPSAMTSVVQDKNPITIPETVRRRAGIAPGDRVEFRASSRTITIKAVGPSTYKPTSAELTAIRKGEAEIARGEHVTLTDLLYDVERRRRKGGTKAARKVSR